MPEPPAVVRGMIAALPDEPGVYRFRDSRGTVLYIGRALRLRRRVRSYWGDLADRARLRGMVNRVAEIEAVVCRSGHEAAWLERNLLARHKPRANRVIGGAESEVYLRLERDGLRVVHTPPADFGPYLGGEQARLAVAGIHRVVPLPYADPRTGSEREMAQARGAVDRPTMVATVTAVLNRDPTAVADLCGALALARDEQAAGQRFERAAALQAQLEAVRWIVADQAVTGVTPADFVASGWADGVLVSFTFVGGSLSLWERSSRTEAGARPLVAATPAPWRELADRNARLAAALRQAAAAQPA